VVELTEPVQLVACDVEEQGVAGWHDRREAHGPGLVELQDGDVVVEPAPPVDRSEQRGRDAPHEVAAGRVRQDPQPRRPEELDDDLRGGRLAVRPRDHGDAVRQLGQGLREEPVIEVRHHEPGEG
jgi:hypothetical protein